MNTGNRILVLLILMLAGCSQEKQKIVLATTAKSDYIPLLSWIIHAESTPTPIVPIVPDPPKPRIGEKCPTCGGDGELGDGTTIKQCRDCDGDGVVHENDLIITGEQRSIISIELTPTYFIEYNGREWIWEDGAFVSPGMKPIKFPGVVDITTRKEVTICNGNQTCSLVPVQKR